MSPQTYSRPRGATLIELTVVISMLFSLISALYVSARYYKEAADKASCITQINQLQKAVRVYQNLNDLTIGDELLSSELYGLGKPFSARAICPLGGGDYSLLEKVPSSGVAFATCAEYDESKGSVDKSQAHTPTRPTGW